MMFPKGPTDINRFAAVQSDPTRRANQLQMDVSREAHQSAQHRTLHSPLQPNNLLVPTRDPQLQTRGITRQNDLTLHQDRQTPKRTTLVQLAYGDNRSAQIGAHLPAQKDLVGSCA